MFLVIALCCFADDDYVVIDEIERKKERKQLVLRELEGYSGVSDLYLKLHTLGLFPPLHIQC